MIQPPDANPTPDEPFLSETEHAQPFRQGQEFLRSDLAADLLSKPLPVLHHSKLERLK